jgi:hypothetical protein
MCLEDIDDYEYGNTQYYIKMCVCVCVCVKRERKRDHATCCFVLTKLVLTISVMRKKLLFPDPLSQSSEIKNHIFQLGRWE